MWRGFENVVCTCNFVIRTVKYTHTLGTGFKVVWREYLWPKRPKAVLNTWPASKNPMKLLFLGVSSYYCIAVTKLPWCRASGVSTQMPS
jgi:hypothetical protein